MSLIALLAPCGAPGVTTTSCILGATWPSDRRVVVVEADPAGGDIAARFGLSYLNGTASFVVDQRAKFIRRDDEMHETGGAVLDPHVQRLPGGLEVVVGPVPGDAAAAVDAELPRLVDDAFVGSDLDVLADLGRIDFTASGQQAVLHRADRVLIVSRADIAGVAKCRWLASRLKIDGIGSRVVLFVRSASRSLAADAAEAIGVSLFAVIPEDPLGAAVACGAARRRGAFARSPLVRQGRRIARDVASTSAQTPGDNTESALCRADRQS